MDPSPTLTPKGVNPMSDRQRVPPDDLAQLSEGLHGLRDGSRVQAVTHDGHIRLVLWDKTEDSAVDEPWVLASVAPNGDVETFGDIPGRDCLHHADE